MTTAVSRFTTRTRSLVRRFTAGNEPWIHGALASLLVVAIAALKYGFGFFPGLQTMLDLTASWREPDSIGLSEDYLLTSAPTFVIAGAAGLTESAAYLAYSLILCLAAVTLPFAFSRVRASSSLQRLIFFILIGGPITPLLFQWIGGYDAITVIASVMAVLSRPAWLRATGWGLIGLNHFFVGIFGAVALSVLLLTESSRIRRFPRGELSLIFAPLLVGGLTAQLVANTWGMRTSRIDMYFAHGWSVYVELFLMQAPLIAFSALGVTWLGLLSGRMRRLTISRVLIYEALILIPLLSFLALDQSRILALVLFLPVLFWAREVSRHSPTTVDQMWRRYWLVAVLVPVLMVYTDQVTYLGWRLFTWLPPLATFLDYIR